MISGFDVCSGHELIASRGEGFVLIVKGMFLDLDFGLYRLQNLFHSFMVAHFISQASNQGIWVFLRSCQDNFRDWPQLQLLKSTKLRYVCDGDAGFETTP